MQLVHQCHALRGLKWHIVAWGGSVGFCTIFTDFLQYFWKKLVAATDLWDKRVHLELWYSTCTWCLGGSRHVPQPDMLPMHVIVVVGNMLLEKWVVWSLAVRNSKKNHILRLKTISSSPKAGARIHPFNRYLDGTRPGACDMTNIEGLERADGSSLLSPGF